MGFFRAGCIGCPLSGRRGMIREFAIFPKYAEAYKRAFQRAINKRIAEGKYVAEKINTGEKLFKWWIQDPTIEGQIEMDFGNEANKGG